MKYGMCPYCGTKINGNTQKLEKHLWGKKSCPSRLPINLKRVVEKVKKRFIPSENVVWIPKSEPKSTIKTIEEIDKTLKEIEEE